MRKFLKTWIRVLLAGAMTLTLAPPVGARKGKHTDLNEILSQMNEVSKHLRTVSANLDYTTYTKLVDDKSRQSGQLFYRKGKTTEIRIDFQKPENKIVLFKKTKGYMYSPKINQVQEFDLEQKSDLLQQILLLGFGMDTGELKKNYDLKNLPEEDMEGETTVLLELVPRNPKVAAQITKIQIWVSEDSWLPKQQKFFENGGDYLIAHYSGVKRNLDVPNSKFELNAPSTAKHVKMN